MTFDHAFAQERATYIIEYFGTSAKLYPEPTKTGDAHNPTFTESSGVDVNVVTDSAVVMRLSPALAQTYSRAIALATTNLDNYDPTLQYQLELNDVFYTLNRLHPVKPGPKTLYWIADIG